MCARHPDIQSIRIHTWLAFVSESFCCRPSCSWVPARVPWPDGSDTWFGACVSVAPLADLLFSEKNEMERSVSLFHLFPSLRKWTLLATPAPVWTEILYWRCLPCWRTCAARPRLTCSWSSIAYCRSADRLLWSPGTWFPLFRDSVCPAAAETGEIHRILELNPDQSGFSHGKTSWC